MTLADQSEGLVTCVGGEVHSRKEGGGKENSKKVKVGRGTNRDISKKKIGEKRRGLGEEGRTSTGYNMI